MTTRSLPEIRESDAPAHVAAIYADIKQSAALPQVNLIFRHLAYYDGVLEQLWPALRPLYRSQELADAARTLTRSIQRPGLSPLMAALDGEELAQCKLVLDSYNSGNPQNLIALGALAQAVSGEALSDEAQSPAAVVPQLEPRAGETNDATSQVFPALPKREDLSADALARIERMAARHPGAPGVIPSMYLHLALWPAALDAVDIYLQPMIESPGWKTLVAGVIEQAGKTSSSMAPAIADALKGAETDVPSEVVGTIDAFTKQTIPELITVGALLAMD